MDPEMISSLSNSVATIPKLKGPENYKTWAREIKMVFALYPECRSALIEGGGGNDSDNNKSINRTITACLLRSLEPMTASALGNEDELLRMAPAALWKIIKEEYGKISFDTKWKLFRELQKMKISSDYKNYYEVVKQFDERVYRLEEAGLTIKEPRSKLFLNIMPDSARQFLRTSNQVSGEDSKVKG